MYEHRSFSSAFLFILVPGIFLFAACGAQPGAVDHANANHGAANSRTGNFNSNSSNTNAAASTGSSVDTKEPEQYEATVTLKFETLGAQQTTAAALPALSAKVARSAAGRRMEFSIPAGGRVVYLDKDGINYLILPDKKQYAELTRESLGFDVRRMLMPEQIVQQVKNVPGLERVGDETYNGRQVVKYRYGAVADTKTQAGQVATESFLFVDKETGLPLRSETSSMSQSGANVQGVSGIRLVTEITDINTAPAADLFERPADLQKIEAEQVRAQADLIFNAVSMFLGQMLKQGQPPASPGSAN